MDVSFCGPPFNPIQWCLMEQGGDWPKVSVLLGCPFPGALAGEGRLLLGLFFGLCLLAFPGCWLLQPQVWDTQRTQGMHSGEFLGFRGLQPVGPLSESSYVCFIYIFQGF